MFQTLALSLDVSPRRLFGALYQQAAFPVLLESAVPHPVHGRFTILAAEPSVRIWVKKAGVCFQTAEKTWQESGDALEILRQWLPRWQPEGFEAQACFAGGMMGFFQYEFAQTLWPRHRVSQPHAEPYAYFAVYETVLVYDHLAQHYTLYGEIGDWCKRWPHYATQSVNFPLLPLKVGPIQASENAKSYAERVRCIQQLIREGDVYQVNLSQRLHTQIQADPWRLYQHLMAQNPSTFSVFLPWEEGKTVMSASPELFFRLRGKQVLMRPIKGTAPRRQEPEADEQERQALWNSEKNRAELLMIVDLERNDLGKVCEYGSVHVPELQTLESHPSVHHLVASIEGELRRECDVFDLLRAIFPCGSITGAPKLRAMERIAELETEPRGIYTGNLGWLDFAGNACFNVAIRTLSQEGERLSWGLGGGIVIDSDPQAEYEETLHKGAGIHQALTGEKLSEYKLQQDKKKSTGL